MEHIKENCIEPAELLLGSGKEIAALTLICLGIEWLGAHLENIPGGAKKRSRKRFEAALNRCFPEQYRKRELDLYRRIRTTSVHNPQRIYSKIVLSGSNRHLQFEDHRLCISITQLLEDLKTAVAVCEV